MIRIQTYLVEPGHKMIEKADLGLVDYPDIPLEGQTFTLGNGKKRYVRRMVHYMPPPITLYIEEVPEAQ
ncbi:MAG: hypothetical protein L0Z62_19335 [Gemmataceae bacterium]|nr:hypothetical protein [Gemmataceae bacterium]